MKKRIVSLILCAFTFICAGLTGCSGSKESTEKTSAQNTTSASTAESTAEGSKEESGLPKPQSSNESKTDSQTQESSKQGPEIRDDDPHKNDKERIIEIVRTILDSKTYQDLPPSKGYAEMNTNLRSALENEGIDFSVAGITTNRLYGQFGDGDRFGMSFFEIYTNPVYASLAKHSSDDDEEKLVQAVLDEARSIVKELYEKSADTPDEMTVSTELYNSLYSSQQRDILEHYSDPDYKPLDYTVYYDGVRATLKNGTKWGFSFAELIEEMNIKGTNS